MSAINAEVDSGVRSLFSVKDYFVTEDGAAEYSVDYDGRNSSKNFLRLLELLDKVNYSAQLFGDPEHATLVVIKNLQQQQPKAQQTLRVSLPTFLFLSTLLSLSFTAYVVALTYLQIVPSSSVLEMGIGFAVAILAIFVARYMAQRYAVRGGPSSGVSYYLPWVPLLLDLPTLYFLPTFGSISFPASPPTNKDTLFDFYLFGSLAMVLVAAVVAILGIGGSAIFTHAQLVALASSNQNATIQFNFSLLQTGILSLAQSLGVVGRVPTGGTLFFSPIEIAAWVGLLLAFLTLIPAALFDGGRMARIVLGEAGSRNTTIVSGLLLLLTDLPNYWLIFFVLFLMAAFPAEQETLDSISELSRSRRVLFVVMIAVGLLCVPVPQTFATLTL